MIRIFSTATSVFLALSLSAATGDVIRTAAELASATFDREEFGRPFEVSVWMTTSCTTNEKSTFAAEDASGAMLFRKECKDWPGTEITPGHQVLLRGEIARGIRSKRAYANCSSLSIIGKRTPLAPKEITNAEFSSGAFDCRLVSLTGLVRDLIVDEISPDSTYLVLSAGSDSIYTPISSDCQVKDHLIPDTKVRITGIVTPSYPAARRHLGRYIISTDMEILECGKTDPFAVPELTDYVRLRPQDIAALGRHKVTGRVLAVWNTDRVLIKTAKGQIIQIELAENSPPEYGETIEAVGFPESDLYRINLTRALWKPAPKVDAPEEEPYPITARDLQMDENGRRRFDPFVHGHPIRLRGIVRTLPGDGNDDGRFNIESDSFIVPVDASSTPDALRGLSVNSEISVSGICIMESDNWRPNAPFPTIRGFTVVVRTPADVVILKSPSWWTPARLAAAVGALLLFLVGSLIWNAQLKRLAEDRGEELARSQLARIEADLKVDERTRLAVELHDSLSQYLTGISLAIRAATRLAPPEPAGLGQNLELATVSLDSCRQELRNCLWDLRNHALDSEDINAAIRQTLEPHIGDAALSVRFNVPRERFTDKSAHAILHILRELATNAIRHGKASHIWVAGSIEGNRLLFSVRDNGCGFDPATCPGMDTGHFGLQGIRERVNQFEGEMNLTSRPNGGTKVTIGIHVPGSKEGTP